MRRRLHAKLAISMDMGVGLVAKDHAPWLAQRRAEIDPYYWNRYRQLLQQQGRAPDVINAVDLVGDKIWTSVGTRCLAPLGQTRLCRRGRSIGQDRHVYRPDLQAADAGYRLIILSTGTLESLRRQTQERLDEGFVGLDSAEKLQHAHISTNRAVGVGVIDQSRYAGVFTSKNRDFNRAFMDTARRYLSHCSTSPSCWWLKRTRGFSTTWRTGFAPTTLGRTVSSRAPLLLIDDDVRLDMIN